MSPDSVLPDREIDALLEQAGDFIFQTSPHLRVNAIQVLDPVLDDAIPDRFRGRPLTDIIAEAIYPAQRVAALDAVGGQGPLRGLSLSFADADAAPVRLVLNGAPRRRPDGAFDGYRVLVSVASGASDQLHHAELLRALRLATEATERERRLRRESDVLLAGLQALLAPTDLTRKCRALFEIFRDILDFREALVVRRVGRVRHAIVIATCPQCEGLAWPDHGAIVEAERGETVMVDDIAATPEGAALPETMREMARSALFAPLNIGGERAIVIALSSRPGGFLQHHHVLMQRLSLIAGQAFEADEREAALVNAAKMAALGETQAMVGHELKQPLSVMAMTVQNTLLHLERGAEPERLRQKLERIRTQIDRIAQIAKAIQAIAHPARRAGKSDAAIAEVVDAVRLLSSGMLQRRGVTLEAAVPEKVLVSVDPINLQQVFLNLVGNAAHAIADRRGPDGGRIRIAGEVQAGRLAVTVADNGGGIPADAIERVFAPFFTLKGVGEGTGLGLAICRQIVEEAGGRIAVVNDADGAVFTLDLPIAEEAAP